MTDPNMIPVKEHKQLPEGLHTGVIKEVVRRLPDPERGTYDYTDYYIEEDETKIVLKAGYPSTISVDDKGEPKTKHTQMLKRIGFEFNVGTEINVQKAVGTKVQFQTMNEETKDGTYSRIIRETVKAAS